MVTAADAPSEFTATAGDTQVTLTWDDPEDNDITGYRVLWMEPTDKLDDPSDPDKSEVAIAADDRFGHSVGIDGGRAVVGAPFQESLTNADADVENGGWGHAFSRNPSTGVWSYDEFLALNNPQEEGRLGSAVAMAGRTAVAGAPSYYQSQNNDPGNVFIGVKDQSGWGGKFSATGDDGNDFFGASVAIDGGTAVVGATGVAVGSATFVGKAYVFTRSSSNQDTGVWSQETVLDSGSNAGQGTVFGTSVAVDGNTIVVGSQGEDTYKGAAYVFTKSNNGWSRVARLTAPNSRYGDGFGGSVAIDGDTIVVGAQNWDEGSTDAPQHGAAFIFTKNNNVWSRVARLTASDYAAQDQFGFAVAVEGDTIVVGDFQDDDDGDDSGSVYLFTKPSGGWATANETVQLTASGAAAGDNFGFSVAARGGRFIVGAPGVADDEDSADKGAAYVYSIPEWTDITVPASNSGTMSHTVTGLDNGVEYTFWVLPVVSSGLGPASDTVTATPTAAKAATPANLTALGIDQEVTLSWDDPNDASIIRYRYRQKEGDGTFGSWNDIALTDIDSSETGKLKYTVSNLTNGTTYTFQIFAKDNHEDSETSAEASATPAPPPPLPLVPPFVSNIGQVTDISVGADADLSRDQAQQFLTGADGAGYVLGSIDVYFQRGTNSANLTVSVWNTNTDGNPGSTAHTLTNPDTIEPGFVRFTAPASAQLAANTTYFVYVAFSASGTPPLLRTTASTNVDVGAAPNWSMTNYRHQAEPSSLTGWAYQSTLLKISINQVLNPPAAPANLEATVGDGHVVLSWDNPQDDYITKYQYSTDSGASYTDIDSSETEKFKYTVENLTNGRTYTFAVRAVNSADDGDASTKTVVMMPAAPTGLTSTPLDAKVELSWDDPSNDTIKKYQYSTNGGTNFADIPESDASTITYNVTVLSDGTETALANGTTYTLAVRAVNPSGDGPASTATETPMPVPAAPVILSATPGDGQVALTWDDPEDVTITKYQYSTDYVIGGENGNNGGASFTDIDLTTLDFTSDPGIVKYTITGLDNGVMYTLALRAVNPSGESAVSTATALMVPAKPTGLTGIEYNSQVELGWDGSDDSTITKYQLLQIAPSKLTAGDAARDDDFFGVAVAVDGDTALVGAVHAYDAGFDYRTGAAYVFTKNSAGSWTHTTLTALDRNDGHEFGQSVALDGDTAVVGAPGADKGEAGEGQVTGTGAAYVFIRGSAGSWTQAAKLTAEDAEENDQFAYSVAVYDDTVVIGAHQDDDNGPESGSVYVFTKPANGGWTSTNTAVKLTAPDAAAGGYYGNSVAIDGNTIVVGANKADSAYAITKPSSDANNDGFIDWEDWDSLDADGKATFTATLTAFEAAEGDEFGISVAVDGNTVVVGARQHDQSDTVDNSGAAYVFTKPGNAWVTSTETAKLTASDGASRDEFGISVAVSGDTVVIGAHRDDDKGTDSGSAYVFTKPAAGWETTTETAKIIDHDGAASDQFGWSVAVFGSTVLIGARGDDGNKGAAHIMGIPSWTDISDSAAGGANATSYTVTGLTNDVMYTFQLHAVNVSGHSPASDMINVTPKAVPLAPDNLTAMPQNGQVALSWDNPGNATITKYQYSTDGGENFSGFDGGSDDTTTSYTVSGLTIGRTYALALRAVNSLGNGAASTVYVVMMPAAPTNLSAAPDDGKVVLSWADPGNATITKYQYSTDGGTNFSDFDGGRNSDATANTVTGLTNYQEYSFHIRAVNASGEGPVSNSASATPRAPKPAKPTGLTAEAGDMSVMLNWDDPNNETITEYQISEVIEEDFLIASVGAASAHFGISVAIDGDTAVVGADRANNRKGSVYIFTRDSNGNWTQQAQLDGGKTGDQFGWSVAVDGDTVVVGAHAYDGEDAEGTILENSGAVYVFTKPNTDTNSDGLTDWKDWKDLDDDGKAALTAKLTATVPEAYAFFGGSVALDGNTLAIGSRLYDTEGYLGAGAAYVFTKDSGTGVWSQAAKLTASTSLQLAYLGYSLAVDGDTVLVGAYGDDTVLGELGSGSAYVFDKPSGGWADWDDLDQTDKDGLTAKLTASDRQPSGYFGFSVALDSGAAVIGARQHNDPKTGAGSGAAYVFTKQSGMWGERAKLTASDAVARDNFGVSVAVDGDTVVVGSWQDDENGRNSGSAYVFTKPALGWANSIETLKLTALDGAANDRFGWSVSVDEDAEGGSLALVGAYSDDHDVGDDGSIEINAGSVHALGIPDWKDIDPSDDQTKNHTVSKELDDPDTDLSNGTEYTFQIRAMNESGAGHASDGASATPGVKPAQPVWEDIADSDAGDTQARLRWRDPDPPDESINYYEYQQKEGGNGFGDWIRVLESTADTTEYTVTGLVNDTVYAFKIRAVNEIGESPSSEERGLTPQSSQPGQPQGLTATPGDTQVRLTWDDPRDFSINYYQYQWTGTNNTSSWNAAGSQDDWILVPKLMGQTIVHRHTVTGLTNGITYTFRVRAVDDEDDVPGHYAEKTAMPRGVSASNVVIPPGAPTELKATGGHQKVELTWDYPDDASIDGYEYRHKEGASDSTNSFSAWMPISNSDANTVDYVVTGLTNGIEYTFVVQAVDLVGVGVDDDEFSGASNQATATPMPGQPSEPENLAARKGDSQVTLSWQHPDTTDAPITKYEFVHLLQTAPLQGEGDDKFGYAVAVDGDTAVIGAYQDDREDDAMTPDVDESAVDSGAAYVFTRVEGVWEERVKLTASDGEAYDNFGISVAVSGDTVVIGASGDDGAAANSGSVYVFVKPASNGGWADWKDLADDAKDALTAKLTASDAAPLDYFGHSVAVSGDTVLVGAYQDDDEDETEDSGSAYIFVKPVGNGGWTDATETAKLTPDDAADDDYFGTSVALDGDTAVIGAPWDDDNGIDSGSAYVFVKPITGWTTDTGINQTAKLTASKGAAGDGFGVSVAVDGDTVVVGAPGEDRKDDLTTDVVEETVVDAGSAYVFVKPSVGGWARGSEPSQLTAADGEAGDFFGYSVAVNIDTFEVQGEEEKVATIVVGAYGDDREDDPTTDPDETAVDAGSAYVFTRDSFGKWSQTNKLTAKEPEAWDWFGYSVSVDSPGHTALVGAGSAHLLDTHDWKDVPGGKDARTHIVDGLSNGRMYDFKVRGVNSFHQGPPAVGSATPGTGGSSLSANNNPEFNEGDNITRAVSENAPVRTPVGGPVTATDADNDRLEYSLFGEDQASFDLDRWTAQLTTETSLDFEAQNQYSVRVEVKDGNGGYDIVNLTITVVDVDEPPSQPGTPQVFVAGPTGLTVGWTEPHNQGPAITDYDVQYREVGGQFQDAGYNGLGTSVTLEDLTSGTGYEVQVRAVNDEGVSPWSDSGRGETGDAEEGPAPTEPTIGATPAPTPGPTRAPVTGPTPTAAPTGAGGPTPTAGSPTTTDQGPGFTPESTGATVPTPMFDPVVKPIPVPQAAPIPESAPTVSPEPASPVSQVTAPTPAPTPAAEPALSGADNGDGGFPWWIILVILIGIAAAILLIRRKFAGKGQERHSH